MSQSPDNPAATVTTLSLKPGDRVDSFTVVGTIATTGSAVVYKAHDELLDRHVAIKQIILGDGDTDAALRKRIREEAAIHKRVSTTQPKHLIQFIDAVDDERGLMLVSEYYPSKSLEDLLAESSAPLDERQALGIVAATAKGLEAIHQAGVVHRDLKPSNVLLGQDGGLKICDFGLAALIEAQDSLSLGSVRYMAPELLRSEPADGRADLYSLGIMAYEMLAGRANFDNAFRNVLRDQRNQAMRWMKWHTNARVAAPLLDDFLADLPTHLVQLVARMMEKDPARRVGSARDILEAIRRHFLGDEPDPEWTTAATPHAAATTSPGDTAPLPTRSRLPVLLGGLLLFWIVVGGILFVVNDQRKAAAHERAVTEARTLIDEGIALYREGETAEALAKYEAALAGYPGLAAESRDAQLGVYRASGRLAYENGDYNRAIEQYELYRDHGGNPANVEQAIDDARLAGAFDKLTAEAEQRIENLEFPEAQQVVNDARQESWSDEQSQRLDELEALIATRRAQTLAAERIDEATTAADAGDLDRAIAALEDLGDALPEDGRALLEQLRQRRDYQQAIARADAAEARGDFGPALDALTTAHGLRPDPALHTRIDRLEARVLIAEAATLFEAGEFQSADQRLIAALAKDADNAEATRLREQIAARTELSAIERRGDAAAVAGSFAEAITAYEAALKLAPGNATIRTKLSNVRVRDALSQARTAMDEGRLDRAQQILEAAQTLTPENGELNQMLTDVETRRRYVALLAEADEARQANDFRRAKRLYRSAGELIPGDQITQRLADTEYDESLFKARQFFDDGELTAARAMVQQARRIRNSEELRVLAEQIEDAAARAAADETNP
jgi:tetratricopeptide (TPR) repeat protein